MKYRMRKILFASVLVPIIASAQSREATDSIDTQILNEVVVEGASQYTSANKTTYLPDRNSKRTAQNAADLLSKMAIPQIAWIDSRWYDSTTKNYSTSLHRFINITASYTFNFGNKIRHGDELQNSGGSSSAIMK